MKRGLALLLVFVLGFAAGGFTFVRTQARELPAISDCGTRCLRDPQLLGLLASVAIRLAPGALPRRAAESDECIAIDSPRPDAPTDLVFFPKRDIATLLDVTADDEVYVRGCFALMRKLVNERGLHDWRVLSNGPGEQQVGYLHFHLFDYTRIRPAAARGSLSRDSSVTSGAGRPSQPGAATESAQRPTTGDSTGDSTEAIGAVAP